MVDLNLPPRTLIKKGWGDFGDGIGEVFVYHTNQENERSKMNVETVKLLYIKTNKKLSFHVHNDKKEIFFCALGQIELTYAALKDTANKQILMLKEGDSVLIMPHVVHSMIGAGEGVNILVEVSTLDKAEDSIRIIKGD